MSLLQDKKKTDRNSLTRMSIGEAIIQLIQHEHLDEVKIASVCKRAGVSRMTFYHYYQTKLEALQDYLNEIILQYLQNEHAKERFGSYEHILFSLQFFTQYSDYILGLTRVGCYNILIDGVNKFLEEHNQDAFHKSVYDLYFYSGALLNTFVKWLENGKKEPIEEIAGIIAKYSVQTD